MRTCKWTLALALVALAGCENRQATPDVYGNLGSFVVEIQGVWAVDALGARSELDVVGNCRARYGNVLSQVPAEVRGTKECRYAIPRGSIEVELTARTLDRQGQPVTDLTRDVSLRVIPGDIDPSVGYRKLSLVDGVGTGVLRASHVFDTVRVWVEDLEPRALPGVVDGVVVGRDDGELDADRSKITGVSKGLYFQEPSLATLQVPDGADNRGSPLVGQFVSIGRAPESGSVILQNCPDPTDPANQKPMQLVVTGADNSGFYVTDLTACRVPESVRLNGGAQELYDARTGQSVFGINPEPAHTREVPSVCASRTGLPSQQLIPEFTNPGSFGSIYVYNYNYPEGLYPGDLLWTLAGSVQEFTSTTQLTFPSWTVRESMRLLPQERWDDYLECVPVTDIRHRLCGVENRAAPWVTDIICGQNTRNLKMESLESGLVRVNNVRFPTHFENCDLNGDGQVSFFCDSNIGGTRQWTHCDFDHPSLKPDFETACHVACVTMQRTVAEEPFLEGAANKEQRTYDFQGAVCSEKSTYDGFGQFVVELAGPGAAEGGLDPTLTERYETLALLATPVAALRTFTVDQDAVVWCSQEVRFRFDGGAPTVDGDTVLPAGQVLHHRAVAGAGKFSVQPTGAPGDDARCTVGLNPRTRINLITRDAVPDLEPSCDPASADAEAAAQCRALQAATFDVVGHLKHIQPARPRWGVLPRDADDLCCHPGPGLSCPRPIKPCP